MTKQELRKHIRKLKESQSASDRKNESSEILHTLEGLADFQSARTILLYYSLPDEVDTHGFVSRWSSSKTILLPVVTGSELAVRRYSAEKMQRGCMGIEEPEGDDFTDFDAIDLVVVPGMAFDSHGNRLGRGKGYYDRLLPKLKRARKIGICFGFQYAEQIPSEEHDVRVDTVVTKRQC